MSDTLATQVEVFDGSVGTAATQIFAAGSGTVTVVIKNDDGVDDLYVGWSSDLDEADPTTLFINGTLAPAGSLTLENYRGAIYLKGENAGVDYRVERRYVYRNP